MARRKQTGRVRTSASRKKSPRAGRTRTPARSGMRPAKRPSGLGARVGVLAVPTKRRARRIVFIDGPYWSQAFGAFRVERREYDQHDRLISESAFFCSQQEHAETLAHEARKDQTRQGWEATREIAITLAQDLKDGFLYRIMYGQCETFKGRPRRYDGGFESVR